MLVVGALSLAGCAQNLSGRRVLPPDLESHSYHYRLRGFEEPPLWGGRALRGYRSRMRLAVYRRGSIRIDEHSNGRVTGHVVLMDYGRGPGSRARVERDFVVSRADLEGLRERVAEAGLWRSPRQFWASSDPDSICIDGIELVFERADAQGYRFAAANAQCTASPALLAVAARFFDIAGERQLRPLLE